MKLNRDYFTALAAGPPFDVIDFVATVVSDGYGPQRSWPMISASTQTSPGSRGAEKPYPLARAFRNDEMYCQQVLCDYLHLLERWKVEYAPQCRYGHG